MRTQVAVHFTLVALLLSACGDGGRSSSVQPGDTDGSIEADSAPWAPAPQQCEPLWTAELFTGAVDVVCERGESCRVELSTDESGEVYWVDVSVTLSEYIESFPHREVRVEDAVTGRPVNKSAVHISPGRYDVRVTLGGARCGRGIAGALMLADDELLDEGYYEYQAQLSPDDISDVTFRLDFPESADSERWEESTWLVMLSSAGTPPTDVFDEARPEEFVGYFEGSSQRTVPTIHGTYDIWVARRSAFHLPEPDCSTSDEMGLKKVLSNVRIDGPATIPVRANPQSLLIRRDPVRGTEGTLAVSLYSDEIEGLDRRSITVGEQPIELSVWPGHYTLREHVSYRLGSARARQERPLAISGDGDQTLTVKMDEGWVSGSIQIGSHSPGSSDQEWQIAFFKDQESALTGHESFSFSLEEEQFRVPMRTGNWVVGIEFPGSEALTEGRYIIGEISLTTDGVNLGHVDPGHPARVEFAGEPPELWLKDNMEVALIGPSSVHVAEWPIDDGLYLVPGKYALEQLNGRRFQPDDERWAYRWRMQQCIQVEAGGTYGLSFEQGWTDVQAVAPNGEPLRADFELRSLGDRKGTQPIWSQPLLKFNVDGPMPLIPGIYRLNIDDESDRSVIVEVLE